MEIQPPTSAHEICDYEGSPWQTKFWPGREYEDRSERIAIAHLLPSTGTRLCEIGAGFGRLANFYSGYRQVILLDYSRSMLREAVNRLRGDPRFIFVAADLYALPIADSAVDTTVTVRVLHHVIDIPRAFSEISRIVRPGGSYLGEFANKRHLKQRLRYALTHRPPDPSALEPYEFVKLNFDFHPRYIQENLRLAQLNLQNSRAVSIFRLALLKRLVPAGILAALDGLLQSPTSRLELSPSIFVQATSVKPGAPETNPALWRCPACQSTDMAEANESLICRKCAHVYPIADGIIDFKSQL